MEPIQRKSIRIEAGGGPRDVRVIDTETGRDLTKVVQHIEWSMGANDLPHAVIHVLCAPVDIVTSAEIRPDKTISDLCDRIRELEQQIENPKSGRS